MTSSRRAGWRRAAVIVLGAMSLAGCGDTWFGASAKPPLPGERLSVLRLERRIEVDASLASLEVRLPRPLPNEDWPMPGGFPNHAMQHPALGDKLERAWRTSIGTGATRTAQVLASPVVSDNVVYTMDSASHVSAVDAKSGSRRWRVNVTPEDDAGRSFGGGVAVAEGRVFVTTGYGQVIALDPKTGKELWRVMAEAPLRGGPTVSDGRVFVVTVDNQLDVFATEDGRRLWTHAGTPEAAGLLGGSSPAVEGDVVVVTYSSGEIFALRVENGRPLWNESIAVTQRLDALSSIADIRGLPVIDRGRVFAISHSGSMVSIDLRSGERVWEQDIGGIDTPWVAGDFVYVLGTNGELFCLSRRDGRVKWLQELPRYENVEKKRRPIRWTGPVLAGDRLVVLASNGEAMSYSPYTGDALGRISLPDGTFLLPVVAGETLYVLTSDADLIALR